MKKIMFISILVLLGFLVFKYFTKEDEDFERQVYVLTDSHYHLYEEGALASVTYFTNDEDFSIIDETTVGYIYNEELTIKFILSGFKESEIHSEFYNGQQFYGKKIYFKLPMINDTYTLKNMFLELDNLLTRYKFYVGTMHVAYQEDIRQFDLRTLEGKQGENYSLSQIIVGLNKSHDIDKITIGPYEANFSYEDMNLIIEVPKEIYMLSDTYVLIHEGGNITFLPQFKYFFSYELLKSGYHQKYLI